MEAIHAASLGRVTRLVKDTAAADCARSKSRPRKKVERAGRSCVGFFEEHDKVCRSLLAPGVDGEDHSDAWQDGAELIDERRRIRFGQEVSLMPMRWMAVLAVIAAGAL